MPTKTTKPTPRMIRDWLESRTHAPDDEPPPSPEDIRRLLDWHVVPDGELKDQQ